MNTYIIHTCIRAYNHEYVCTHIRACMHACACTYVHIYIHVNMHKIRANKKHGTNEAVITVKEGRKNTYGHEVEIHGPSKIVYGGNDKPLLPCGARVVIETEAEVTIK